MELLQQVKRFEVSKLFVCGVFSATNLHSTPYIGIGGAGRKIEWTKHFLGITILYGGKEILKDPLNHIKYIPQSKLSDCNHNKPILYYEKLGNITDAFSISSEEKIPLAKLEDLNIMLKSIIKKNNSGMI